MDALTTIRKNKYLQLLFLSTKIQQKRPGTQNNNAASGRLLWKQGPWSSQCSTI